MTIAVAVVNEHYGSGQVRISDRPTLRGWGEMGRAHFRRRPSAGRVRWTAGIAARRGPSHFACRRSVGASIRRRNFRWLLMPNNWPFKGGERIAGLLALTDGLEAGRQLGPHGGGRFKGGAGSTKDGRGAWAK